MSDFLIRGEWSELDPQTYELNEIEAERQYRKLILVASESTAPLAVRQALNSAFNNIYAEGYPDDDTRRMTQADILDYNSRLALYRRYGVPRYYKGVEYADAVESLARRRCAELFADERFCAEDMLINVQPLSGAAANNAVYHALMDPGDTVMGMNMMHGGHLSHGARVNRSGKVYQSVPYGIDPDTERIDYDAVRRLAHQHKPKMIIAGFSSYPWIVDWEQFRDIADDVGAYLMADIAHVAGLVAAGEYPSPIGVADVVSFTTHKSLCGPRGACIVATDAALANKIDRAVFPGEQGGPHLNTMLAMAVMFKLDNSNEFRALQKQVRVNALRFSQKLSEMGFRIAFGGTDTHLFNVDCKSITGKDGTPLMGEVASRILDLSGIVVNRNTIPGDEGVFNPSGLRFGTVWVTQRGFRVAEIDDLAGLTAEVLQSCFPYVEPTQGRKMNYRAKVDFDVLNDVKVRVRSIAQDAGIDFEPVTHGYPHFYDMAELQSASEVDNGRRVLVISGRRAHSFLQQVITNDLDRVELGGQQRSLLLEKDGRLLDDVFVQRLVVDMPDAPMFLMAVHNSKAERVKAWLRGLSDGYLLMDPDDVFAKVDGPVVILDMEYDPVDTRLTPLVKGFLDAIGEDDISLSMPNDGNLMGEDICRAGHELFFGWHKTYFIGCRSLRAVAPPGKKAYWSWQEPEEQVQDSTKYRHSCLYEVHTKLNAHMAPFADWEMPLWYSSASEEHRATRVSAGLFDISHMGVFAVSGPHAETFLDTVATNYIRSLEEGRSRYSCLLDCDGNVIDDVIIYRLYAEDYLIVVNAANADKDWDWFTAVNQGDVALDASDPLKAVGGPAVLKDLRDPVHGLNQKVGIALQGPKSCMILQRLAGDAHMRKAVKQLPRTAATEVEIAGVRVVLARTGYTGESIGYEIFLHPEIAPICWNAVLEVGTDLGMKPAGLAARDSTRIEAGLPLYGHELAGPHNINPYECGLGAYVKLHKPFFVGRQAYIDRVHQSVMRVIRYRITELNVRPPREGNSVVDRRGRIVGHVTSSARGSDGYMLGQAYVGSQYSKPGTQIGILQAALDSHELPYYDPKIGDRVPLHSWAEVLPRFRRS